MDELKRVLAENVKLRLQVEELKRQNEQMGKTIEVGMQYTDHLHEKFVQFAERAQQLIHEEHCKHCVACATHAVAQTEDGFAFVAAPNGGEEWGTN